MYKYIFLLGSILLTISCSSLKVVSIGNLEQPTDKIAKKSKKFRYKGRTKEPLAYAPTKEREQWTYKRKIRVNVHFMHDSTSTQNIPEEEVEKYALYLVYLASERLKANQQMVLPVGNNTAVLNPNYEYQLYPNNKDAVYIHHDNELFYYVDRGKYRNNYSRNIINKYSIDDDKILNIFVIPHHPDSIESKTYPGYAAGIAMGHNLKISGNFHNNQVEAWEFSPILNHEIGHIMGLGHSWTRSDGCDDTPQHSNCYSNTGVPPCDQPTSNNMMDYNASEIALTPCQIGKIHMKIANLKSRQRALIVEDWCQLDTSRSITINGQVKWDASLDLSHSVIIEPGASLHINCRVSFPKGASIYVSPGATLILDNARLHNACGDQWNGIKLASKGRKNKGQIIYKEHVRIEDVGDL